MRIIVLIIGLSSVVSDRVIFSPDELSRSTVEASESEKVIQRLNQELQEAHEQANSGKHKCVELQGKRAIICNLIWS